MLESHAADTHPRLCAPLQPLYAHPSPHLCRSEFSCTALLRWCCFRNLWSIAAAAAVAAAAFAWRNLSCVDYPSHHESNTRMRTTDRRFLQQADRGSTDLIYYESINEVHPT